MFTYPKTQFWINNRIGNVMDITIKSNLSELPTELLRFVFERHLLDTLLLLNELSQRFGAEAISEPPSKIVPKEGEVFISIALKFPDPMKMLEFAIKVEKII